MILIPISLAWPLETLVGIMMEKIWSTPELQRMVWYYGLFWLWKTTSNLKDSEQHGNTRPGKLTYQLANWKMAIEIVDLPIKNGGFP